MTGETEQGRIGRRMDGKKGVRKIGQTDKGKGVLKLGWIKTKRKGKMERRNENNK
jgi:hypothetical protein